VKSWKDQLYEEKHCKGVEGPHITNVLKMERAAEKGRTRMISNLTKEIRIGKEEMPDIQTTGETLLKKGGRTGRPESAGTTEPAGETGKRLERPIGCREKRSGRERGPAERM